MNSILANRYKIVRLIGGGGMKNVYLAEDLHLNSRHCAVAEMIDVFSDAGIRAQAVVAFQREAKLLAGLQEAHIPRIFDSFNEQNCHCLVMEYIDGETLEEILAKSFNGRLPESEVIDIALEVLQTLEYLHGLNPPIIYRDLKPSNVMVAKDGSVKLIDFGIARYFQPSKTATMIGTQGYAAPEQYKGKAEPCSDLYSLGALMHHLLSGRDPSSEPPFSFPRLSEVVPNCSVLLTEIVNRALQYDLASRMRSAAEFRQRLTQARDAKLSSSAATVRISTQGAIHKTSKFRTYELIGGLVLSLIIAAVASYNHEHSPTPESTPMAPYPAASPDTAYSPKPSAEAGLATPVARVAVPGAFHTPRSFPSGSEGKRRYFGIGSSKDEVRAVQGIPTGVINGNGFAGDIWNYGLSSIDFTMEGYVKGYSNISRNLRVWMGPSKKDTAESYFVLGSTKDEVLAIQGTPTEIISGDRSIGDIWWYGFSSVQFSTNGTVVGYSNIGRNLRIRVRN
jgi:serine/threonine protein kinase